VNHVARAEHDQKFRRQANSVVALAGVASNRQIDDLIPVEPDLARECRVLMEIEAY